MTGYAPKRGDRVRISYEGRVDIIDTTTVRFLTGQSFNILKGNVELVEPAPVPFEVGKPLTKEMGEPPIGSVLRGHHTGSAYRRDDDGLWYTSGKEGGESWYATPENASLYTLLHLGDGK